MGADHSWQRSKKRGRDKQVRMEVNEAWQEKAGMLLRSYPSAGWELVAEMLEEHGHQPLAQNLAAWLLCCHAPEEFLGRAVEMAEKACEMDPENLEFHHTAAWAHASRETWEGALPHLRAVMAAPAWVEPWVEDIAHLCLKSVMSGKGMEMLEMVEGSRSRQVLAGVAVAMRLRLGMPTEAGSRLVEEARLHIDAFEKLYAVPQLS